MKLKNTYTLTELADDYIAVPLDNEESFRGVIKLNASGAEVFQGLIEGQTEEQLAKRLTKKYPGLDSESAEKAVATVLDSLKQAGLLEE